MKAAKTLILTFLLLLASTYSAKAQLAFDILPALKVGEQGATLTYSGTFRNTGTDELFLNGTNHNLSATGLMLDDSKFFANAPVSLVGGASWSGNLFDVAIDVSAPLSIYSGNFSILGGLDNVVQDVLATSEFNLIVTSQTTLPHAYVATSDFTISTNQSINGVWSYGQGIGSGFTLLSYSDSQSYGVDDLIGWRGTLPGIGQNYPVILGNKSGRTLSYPEVAAHPADLLLLHPAPDGTEAVLRWTAPEAGTYRLAGRFEGLQLPYPTTDVRILLNGSSVLFSGYIDSLGTPLPFDVSYVFRPNDQVDFAVGYGGNGYAKDGTGLDVVVTRTTDVPESGTLVMLTAPVFFGGSLLVRRRWK